MAATKSTLKVMNHPGWIRLAPPYDQVTVRVVARVDGIIYQARGLPDELLQSGAVETAMLEPGRRGDCPDSAGDIFRIIARDRHSGRWAVRRCITTVEKARGLPGVPSDIALAESEAADRSPPTSEGVPTTAEAWKLQAGRLLESMTDVAKVLMEEALGPPTGRFHFSAADAARFGHIVTHFRDEIAQAYHGSRIVDGHGSPLRLVVDNTRKGLVATETEQPRGDAS
jgi:hypothetical protein